MQKKVASSLLVRWGDVEYLAVIPREDEDVVLWFRDGLGVHVGRVPDEVVRVVQRALDDGTMAPTDSRGRRKLQRSPRVKERTLEELEAWDVYVRFKEGTDRYGVFFDLAKARAAAEKHAQKPGVLSVHIDGSGQRATRGPSYVFGSPP
jgi:hypothetical protein